MGQVEVEAAAATATAYRKWPPQVRSPMEMLLLQACGGHVI
jgi:hypothetical protein